MTGVALDLLTLYSDKRSADVAARFCESLTRRCPGHCSTWSAELLRSPKLRAFAAEEAAKSDVVVIALPEGQSLAAPVMKWLTEWQRRSNGRKTTLVALLERPDTAVPTPVEKRLHKFASRVNANFFCRSEVRRQHARAGATLFFSAEAF